MIVGLAERARDANAQAEQIAHPVVSRRTLTFPRVERQVLPKPPLTLSDVDDELFIQLGRQTAAAGGATLARKRLDVIRDPSSPTGLKLVPVEAQDVIDASRPQLPFEDVAATLKQGLLASDFVRSSRPSDLNAARRLAEALVTGAGGPHVISPYINQVIVAAQRMLQTQLRDSPETVVLTVESEQFGPARTNARPVELNRFGKFRRDAAYDTWSDSCLHALNWFDTEPERRMANLLDDAGPRRVCIWARIQRGEFVVQWQGGRYSPDFYAQIDHAHHLIEVKGDDRKDAPDVQAKKAAAEQWARHVTDDGNFGVWTYLFVPQSVLAGAKTLDDVLALAKLGRR